LLSSLTSALEDYLETIYELLRLHPVARVKDIARERQVKAGSVSPALKRLSELGLVDYVQREYVTLTPEGERQARRVFARHTLLTRFFEEILQMEAKAAEAQACAMEHSLSDEGMDRLVRFFEFLTFCPNRPPGFLEMFHQCSLVHEHTTHCSTHCDARARRACRTARHSMSLVDLAPGERATVAQVGARGAVRQRLLDMGMLPAAEIEVERVAPTGDPVWIRLGGTQLALRRAEAASVRVVKA
jgi:DtxR family Mn-dependent transcriptional regulator